MHIHLYNIISNKKTFLLLKAFELASVDQNKSLSQLLQSSNMMEKVEQVTKIYNDLNIKNIATNEANKYTEIALTHLKEIEANADKKESLKQFAFHLLNREI